jgi:uncharacterized membrane protein
MKAPDLFSEAERKQIHAAIHEAEMLTSGEIRVYIDDDCRDDVMDKAAFVFAQLNMHQTALRNGVLIYLAVNDHKFAIIGDAGIHQKVGDTFWNSIKQKMAELLKEGKYSAAIEYGVREAGRELQHFFPRSKDDQNELPNDIVFGKGGGK